jgi:hypothetical protein
MGLTFNIIGHFEVSNAKCLFFFQKKTIILRVMIHYHLLIQLFTTLLMWQDGPLPYFIFKT